MTPREKLIFKFLLTVFIVGLITGFVRHKWFGNSFTDMEEASKITEDINIIINDSRNENIVKEDEFKSGENSKIEQKDIIIIPVKKVNLNTSSKTELMTLPGIGPSIAERIIIYRDNNGYFKDVEDIMKVKGIGEATLGKIKEMVTL